MLVAPGVAEGSDGDAVGVGDGDANNRGLSGFGLRTLGIRVNPGDRLRISGLGGVAGVGGGRVEGGGGGMTKGDRGEKMLGIRERKDDSGGGGKDGTKKGGSVGDGRRPKP